MCKRVKYLIVTSMKKIFITTCILGVFILFDFLSFSSNFEVEDEDFEIEDTEVKTINDKVIEVKDLGSSTKEKLEVISFIDEYNKEDTKYMNDTKGKSFDIMNEISSNSLDTMNKEYTIDNDFMNEVISDDDPMNDPALSN